MDFLIESLYLSWIHSLGNASDFTVVLLRKDILSILCSKSARELLSMVSQSRQVSNNNYSKNGHPLKHNQLKRIGVTYKRVTLDN